MFVSSYCIREEDRGTVFGDSGDKDFPNCGRTLASQQHVELEQLSPGFKPSVFAV